jgi:hypothetical protein
LGVSREAGVKEDEWLSGRRQAETIPSERQFVSQ